MTRWVGMALARLRCCAAGGAAEARDDLRLEREGQLDQHRRRRQARAGRGGGGRRAAARHRAEPRRQVALHLRVRRRHDPDHGHRDAARSSAQLPSGPDPEVIVISPDGALIYAANEDDNLVTVIDIASRAAISEIPVGVEPEGMAISQDGKRIVNTSETTNMAHFIDADDATRSPTTCWSTSARASPSSPADDAEVWVSAEIGGTVSVIDNASAPGQAQDHLRDPGRARRGDPAGRRADHERPHRAPSWRSGRPTGWRWSTPRPTRSRTICWSASASGSSPSRPDEKFLYSTNGVSNDISVIDVENLEVIKSVAVGRLPWGVAVKG